MELIIVGASGHGKVAADIAKRCGYRKIMFLDDNVSLKHCMDYPVIGKLSDANKYKGKDFFVAIGDSNVRKCVQEGFIKSGYNIITLIHPKSVVADMVSIGIGTVVMAGAIINPNSKVGKGCIINTGASVDHDNVIEDYVHISVGSHLSGSVYIGEETWIGAGVIVSNNIKICNNCMIGAGAVVIDDIAEQGTYVGVPAKKIK